MVRRRLVVIRPENPYLPTSTTGIPPLSLDVVLSVIVIYRCLETGPVVSAGTAGSVLRYCPPYDTGQLAHWLLAVSLPKLLYLYDTLILLLKRFFVMYVLRIYSADISVKYYFNGPLQKTWTHCQKTWLWMFSECCVFSIYRKY